MAFEQSRLSIEVSKIPKPRQNPARTFPRVGGSTFPLTSSEIFGKYEEEQLTPSGARSGMASQWGSSLLDFPIAYVLVEAIITRELLRISLCKLQKDLCSHLINRLSHPNIVGPFFLRLIIQRESSTRQSKTMLSFIQSISFKVAPPN